ncbi:MAG TPA: type II toxin-antitoxin system VapC family toxin [Myxococcota bacterium]|nr:type II toxin-antitoxin system VapC family toxin [Myxococcota bacterium]
MVLLDVNVLVYAFRTDAEQHTAHRAFVESLVEGEEAFGLSSLVLSGFLRIVTHPRIFATPDPLNEALAFVRALVSCEQSVAIEPGARHRAIFERLCLEGNARGNLVPDAYLAALAIESGCEWITTDRDYARFPGLRWRHPLT